MNNISGMHPAFEKNEKSENRRVRRVEQMVSTGVPKKCKSEKMLISDKRSVLARTSYKNVSRLF